MSISSPLSDPQNDPAFAFIDTTVTRRRALVFVGAAFVIGIGIASAPTEARAATASTPPGSWGGYTNGKIPAKAMTKTANAYLRADSATAYGKMAAAFKAKFKKDLSITSGYRDYPTQQSIFTTRYTPHTKSPGAFWSGRYWILKKGQSVAAVPGTSNHGWALALDLGSNVNVAGSAEKKWADANGPTFGWYPKGNAWGEPWHFEYTAPPAKK